MIISTPAEIDTRLQSLSEVTKQPPEVLVRRILEDALEDWEDYTDALSICAEVDAGLMKVYSLSEVEKHLDERNAMGN